jgi:hypothetical protein
MGRALMWGVMLSGAFAAQALAAPSVEIRDAAARVVIIPEARGDVAASLMKANPKLPIWIGRTGDKVVIHGDLGHRMAGCGSFLGRPGVWAWGKGRIAYADLPQIVIRTPVTVDVTASQAVFGAVQRAGAVDLANHGCGDWTLADASGPVRINLTGSGDTRAASAGSAEVNIAGSGDVHFQAIRGGLNAAITGSGDVTAASIGGPFNGRVAGSGDIRVAGGQTPTMNVAVAGSGDVRFGGVAGSLNASVAGSGDVSVARVTGPVAKQVRGSGDVIIGR